ncbi:MAG: terminase small subunit [Acidiferrobacterales bacterium]
MPGGRLTSKQEQFIAFYLGNAHGNATGAARSAGYKQPHMAGARMMANDAIRARIDAELDSRAMSEYEVLAELAEVARVEWHVLARARELGSKVKALELLGKYHKLWADRLEVAGKDGGPLTFTIQIDRGDRDSAE